MKANSGTPGAFSLVKLFPPDIRKNTEELASAMALEFALTHANQRRLRTVVGMDWIFLRDVCPVRSGVHVVE